MQRQMADIPPSYTPPPPPPPGTPPPAQPGYALPPGYQGPTAPDYPQPYGQQPPLPPAYGQQPWQQPGPGMMAAAGTAGMMSQFTGRAGWSILIGLATIVAPFVVHFVFYVLALIGLLYGIQAIRRGQVIGGVIGIVLNVIGGLLTIFILTNR